MEELIKIVFIGLAVILPLANPLTTVALFLALCGKMNADEFRYAGGNEKPTTYR